MSEGANRGLGSCVALLLWLPVVSVLHAATYGFALMVLWGWFVVPVFAQSPLTFSEAAGLSVFVSLIRYKSSRDRDERPTAIVIATNAAMCVLAPAALLLAGWLVRAILQ